MSTEMPRKSSRAWIWFFVLLAALTVLAIATLVIYNLRQQLKPEQLAAARKLWDEKRPPNYVLTYTKKGDASGTFVVTVRKGKVASVVMTERVVKDNQTLEMKQSLERRFFESSDMNGLFDDIERFLEIDGRKDSPRTYVSASFDSKNGQLLRYVRRVMGTQKRVEIVVEPINIQAPSS